MIQTSVYLTQWGILKRCCLILWIRYFTRSFALISLLFRISVWIGTKYQGQAQIISVCLFGSIGETEKAKSDMETASNIGINTSTAIDGLLRDYERAWKTLGKLWEFLQLRNHNCLKSDWLENHIIDINLRIYFQVLRNLAQPILFSWL